LLYKYSLASFLDLEEVQLFGRPVLDFCPPLEFSVVNEFGSAIFALIMLKPGKFLFKEVCGELRPGSDWKLLASGIWEPVFSGYVAMLVKIRVQKSHSEVMYILTIYEEMLLKT
jgi:hypothetical protein